MVGQAAELEGGVGLEERGTELERRDVELEGLGGDEPHSWGSRSIGRATTPSQSPCQLCEMRMGERVYLGTCRACGFSSRLIILVSSTSLFVSLACLSLGKDFVDGFVVAASQLRGLHPFLLPRTMAEARDLPIDGIRMV
jgi:hypothetical protein